MVVPTTWIRNNMLFSGEHQARQLTEAELKVQRSLQKLSVPDWYLNKRSKSPKIVNVAPIEFRRPSWKCYTPNNSSINSSSSNLADTHPIDVPIKPAKKSGKPTENKACRRQKSPELKNRKYSSKLSHTKEEIFDTWIPEASLRMNASKTLPKVSPSRKIQNINLVLPAVPIDNVSNNLDNETPKRIPNFFKIRATSTPKFSPANLFSSTLIEDSPKPKKVLSQSILERSFVFENSFRSNHGSELSIDRCRQSKNLSQNLLEKTFIFESSRTDQSSENYEDSSMNISRESRLLDKNIDSTEASFYRKEDPCLFSASKSSVSTVREMVRQLEVSGNFQTPLKTSTFTWKKQAPVQTKKRHDFDWKSPVRLVREQKQASETRSPCTRFLNSNRKSREPENVARSKPFSNREKGVVRGIIEILAEKANRSTLPRQQQTARADQNFVRKLVNALETLGRSKAVTAPKNGKIVSVNEDTGSGSESEVKSYTSASVKDTDSGSDSDQRTAGSKSDDENAFGSSSYLPTRNVHREEDSVYWIPVSRCMLPRTSSLLSMVSRFSSNDHSPCLSPIRSDTETDHHHHHHQPWGVTYRRSSNLSRKLFRIDETVVIDSGYSDKSDRSGTSCTFSIEDSNWSEDTQNDSGSDCQSVKVRRSSKRKTIVANAFRC